MSLINKLLNDLEQRQAHTEDDQDAVLDGLCSAYFQEDDSTFNYIRALKIILLILLLGGTGLGVYLYTDGGKSLVKLVERVYNSNTAISLKQFLPDSNSNKMEFLRLEDELLLPESNSTDTVGGINRIDAIQFEHTKNGVDMILEMPEDTPYQVYGLTNPSRTIIEIANASLGFPIHEIQPRAPIEALRYSINEDNMLKLIIESDQPLFIRQVKTAQLADINKLVISVNFDDSLAAHASSRKQYASKAVQFNKLEQSSVEMVDSAIAADALPVSRGEVVKRSATGNPGPKATVNNMNSISSTVVKGDIVKKPVANSSRTYADQLYQQALASYQDGSTAESLRLLNESLDSDPGHVRARTRLAYLLSEQGNIDLAFSVLNEGLMQYPEQVDWLKLSARLMLQTGQLLEAETLLGQHSPELNSNTDYYAMKAAVLQKLNNHAQAARIYRDLLRVNPSQATWWMGLGISLEALKRYSDAMFAYQKATAYPALAGESREYVAERIVTLTNLMNDESS